MLSAQAAGLYVAIHRPSKWGNPYSHLPKSLARFKVGSVSEALARYALWIIDQPDLICDLPSLRGKVLGCYCVPKPCHGHILARLADELGSP